MIVVDTTVWIDFLEARGTAFDRHLAELLENDAPIALVDIVYCEILQGVRDEETYRRTRASLRAHPILRPRAEPGCGEPRSRPAAAEVHARGHEGPRGPR